MNTVLWIVSIVLLVYLGFGSLLYFGQRSILYFPTPEIAHPFEEEVFEIDESIRVIVLNPGKDQGILYFGGNGDAMAWNAPELNEAFSDQTTYLVNYRGYGGSSGKPTEVGLYQDALAIFDAVQARHDGIHVIGRSLGSAVATYVAANRPVNRLVLVTPLDSVASLASRLYPIYPASLMVNDSYNSVSRASQIEAETLVLIAENDRVIPRQHSENLVAALGGAVIDSIVFKGVDHNSISQHPDYYLHLASFIY